MKGSLFLVVLWTITLFQIRVPHLGGHDSLPCASSSSADPRASNASRPSPSDGGNSEQVQGPGPIRRNPFSADPVLLEREAEPEFSSGSARKLFVIVPSYSKHLPEWIQMMKTLEAGAAAVASRAGAGSSPDTEDGAAVVVQECVFARTEIWTVLTDRDEKELFKQALLNTVGATEDRIREDAEDEDGKESSRAVNGKSGVSAGRGGRAAGVARNAEYLHRVVTLKQVLEKAKAQQELDMVDALRADVGWKSHPAKQTKFRFQAWKKLYGCLAAAGLQAGERQTSSSERNRPPALASHACFLLDSEGHLTAPATLCQIASGYDRKRNVFVVAHDQFRRESYQWVMEESHKALARAEQGLNGADFRGAERGADRYGRFYAMSSYHWVMDAALVQGLLAKIPGRTFPTGYYFAEESFYHYVWWLRSVVGDDRGFLTELDRQLLPLAKTYRFLDAYQFMANVFGETDFAALEGEEHQPLELPCGFIGLVGDSERPGKEKAEAFGKALANHGVLFMRCDRHVYTKIKDRPDIGGPAAVAEEQGGMGRGRYTKNDLPP